jgi:serine/threonine-protein kinase
VARELPFAHRRVGEEAVRQGMVAAVVMEAAAREWVAADGEETFPSYLVRREVLRREQREALAKAIAEESGEHPAGTEATGAPDEAKPSHPSEVIKGFRILERLGRGGMGSVYRAEQIGMNRTVALKILRRPLGENPEHVERLKREARLVGALDHPNIVRGLDVGQHGAYHYFAMEFVEGESLREILKRRGVIPEAEALRIVEEVAQALEHAHARGVVHRDVKPGNVIITPEGTAKLTDFGLAKGPADFTLTQSGVTVGTPQYFSPEQARSPADVDIQTDLYSLGSTAYHLLSGVPPHTSDTLAGLITKVLYEKPRTARQVNPKVSAGASFLVEKMMAKQKRHRYREPREVLRDLRALAAGKSIVPRGWTGDFEVQEVRRRFRSLVAGFSILVVGLGAAAVILAYRSEQEARRAAESGCYVAYSAAVGQGIPRSAEEWRERVRNLEEMVLRREEWAGTKAFGNARAEKEEAQKYLAAWRQAEIDEEQAAVKVRGRKFVEAVKVLKDAAEALERGDDDARRRGREPAAWLRDRAREIEKQAFDAAADRANRERERVAKVPVRPGVAERIRAELQGVLDEIRRDYVGEEARAPREVEFLADAVRLVDTVAARIEDAIFGASFRETRERLLAAGDFAALEQELRRIGAEIEKDRELQGDLDALALAPAREEFRNRVPWALEEVRALNERALDAEEPKVRALVDARDYAGALALAVSLQEHAVEALRPRVAGLRAEVDAAKEEADRRVREAVDALDRDVWNDILRRDLVAGRRRTLESPEGLHGSTYADSQFAWNFVLRALEGRGLAALRKRLESGAALAEIQFDVDPSLAYLDPSGIRVVDGPGGAMAVFDAPGQKGLSFPLRLASLRTLLEHSGLNARDLDPEQALARAVLMISASGGPGSPRHQPSRREIEEERARLRAVADRLPPTVGHALAFLESKAEEVLDRMIREEQDKENAARETMREVREALDRADPDAALYRLNLLRTGALAATRFAKERQADIQALWEESQRKFREKGLAALFPGARIEELPAAANEERRTKIRLSFDSDREYLLAEKPDPTLFRVAEDPDVPGEKRLVFLEGGPERPLGNSPFALPCIFKRDRLVRMSFKFRPFRPCYAQFSILGNHVGILNDVGRKENGRGVHAWQSGDWRDADRRFPLEHRRDYLPKGNLDEHRTKEGLRYFQFEEGKTCDVTVLWERGFLTFRVGLQDVWSVRLPSQTFSDSPRTLRILTLTHAWVDDLEMEGVVDADEVRRLERNR